MLPIDLNLGFRVFYYYEGFYFVLAILVGTLLAVRRIRAAGMEAEVLQDALPWILLGALLGARVSHFVFWDLDSLLANPLGLFRIWDGGLSITGGLAGGVLAAYLYLRRRGADFQAYFATASPAILVGQAIGRVGCFLNGDAWGIPTTLPWGISQPRFGTFVPGFVRDHLVPAPAWIWSVGQGFTDPSAMQTVPLHPTQLYESVGDLLLAWVVVCLLRSPSAQGNTRAKVVWLHLGGYSLLRFALEFLHGDRDVAVWAGMTALQIGLVAFALASAGLYLKAGRPAAP